MTRPKTIDALFEPGKIHALPSGLSKILTVMAALRDPERGCPWDLEQTFETIAPFTIEEAYEVRDAIQSGDMSAFREELGDLLLQVVYQSQLASEQGLFDFDTVADGIAAKMIKRHPHVFDVADSRTSDMQRGAWEKQKAEERAAKGQAASVLDGLTSALPALMRAEKLQKRAARVGFDWPDVEGVYEKLDEELDELEASGSPENTEEEIGDVLFTVVNLARKLGVDPEEALRKSSDKFERRFRHMESVKPDLAAQSPDQLEALWQGAKNSAEIKLFRIV